MESKRFDLGFLSCSWIGIAMAGCGGYSAQIHRVDGKAARDTLALVLQSWQSGTSPESWQQKVPAVVVQDKCQVKLTLQNPVN